MIEVHLNRAHRDSIQGNMMYNVKVSEGFLLFASFRFFFSVADVV